MPIQLEYDSKHKILASRASGFTTFDEIQRHIDEEEARGYLCLPEIFDCNDAGTDVTRSQIVLLVDRLLRYANSRCLGPTAIVAKNQMTFGMARMFEIISELHGGPPIGVFDNRDEAERWLEKVTVTGEAGSA